MSFEEAYQGWTRRRRTQAEAALLLGQCGRSFRRHVEHYKADGLDGLNVAHFHSNCRAEFQDTRSYSGVKTGLQGAGLAGKAKAGGTRERAPLPRRVLYQDASTHREVAQQGWDLVPTIGDATGEHTSMFSCEQEGTASGSHGLGRTIAGCGLFASRYSDRGSHYFTMRF